MQAWLQRQQRRPTWSSSTRRTGCRRSCCRTSLRCRLPSCRRAAALHIHSHTKRSQCRDMTSVLQRSRCHNAYAAGRPTSLRHELTTHGSIFVKQANAAGDLDRAEALCVTYAAFCSANAWVLASRLPEARLGPGPLECKPLFGAFDAVMVALLGTRTLPLMMGMQGH